MLICCIRLLCDWSFHLLSPHNQYLRFCWSYLFSLWYDWFLCHCFVLLGEIQFLSGFLFLATGFLAWDVTYYQFKRPLTAFSSYTHFRVFHTSVNQLFLRGIWMTSCLLKFPRFFSLFYHSNSSNAFNSRLEIVWLVSYLQLVSPLHLCSKGFYFLKQGLTTYLSFAFSYFIGFYLYIAGTSNSLIRQLTLLLLATT